MVMLVQQHHPKAVFINHTCVMGPTGIVEGFRVFSS